MLKKIDNHMSWCKIKLNPEEREQICDSRIEYDYVVWRQESDSILDKLNKIADIGNWSFIDIILKIHLMVCEHFVYDEFCYFLGRYDKENDICTIDEKYGRNPNNKWIEHRKVHNRRICFELSRYTAYRIKQLANEECDVFLVSNQYESHYATAVICNDFSIIIDSDDFIKGEDLTRAKLGLEIKGITIVNDEKELVRKALKNINFKRISKKDFEKESQNDIKKKSDYEWLDVFINKTHMIKSEYVFKDLKLMLEDRGYEPKKIWTKYNNKYIQTLYLAWNMGYMVVNSLEIELLSTRAFFYNIQDGKYLPNINTGENEDKIAKDIEYDG